MEGDAAADLIQAVPHMHLEAKQSAHPRQVRITSHWSLVCGLQIKPLHANTSLALIEPVPGGHAISNEECKVGQAPQLIDLVDCRQKCHLALSITKT